MQKFKGYRAYVTKCRKVKLASGEITGRERIPFDGKTAEEAAAKRDARIAVWMTLGQWAESIEPVVPVEFEYDTIM